MDLETTAPAAGPSPIPDDWPARAADGIERAVGAVRDKTVEPVQRITRTVVFGFLAALFVLPAVFLLVVGTFRAVDNYLPGNAWSAWLLFGGIFVVAGGFCWAKKS